MAVDTFLSFVLSADNLIMNITPLCVRFHLSIIEGIIIQEVIGFLFYSHLSFLSTYLSFFLYISISLAHLFLFILQLLWILFSFILFSFYFLLSFASIFSFFSFLIIFVLLYFLLFYFSFK